jgi:hypothetical protein
VYDGSPPDTLLGGLNITSVIQPAHDNPGRHMASLIRKVLAGSHAPGELQMLCQPALLPGDSDGPLAA